MAGHGQVTQFGVVSRSNIRVSDIPSEIDNCGGVADVIELISCLCLLQSNAIWLPYNISSLHCTTEVLFNALFVWVTHHSCASHLQVAKGAGSMLRCNICIELGLLNAAMGTIVGQQTCGMHVMIVG